VIKEAGPKQCLSTAIGRAVGTSHQRLFLVNVTVADFIYIALFPFCNLESESLSVIIHHLWFVVYAIWTKWHSIQIKNQ
jgi:hypothetical protein